MDRTLLLELFSLVPRTMTPAEEKLMEDALEKSAHLDTHVEWQHFIGNLVTTHNVKIMAMFWKLLDEFDIISDEHVRGSLMHALKIGIRSALEHKPSKIEDMTDPALLKYYKIMHPDYESAVKLQ